MCTLEPADFYEAWYTYCVSKVDIQTCEARATQQCILLGTEICLYVIKPSQKYNTCTTTAA